VLALVLVPVLVEAPPPPVEEPPPPHPSRRIDVADDVIRSREK
jgi:hypothetical protein